MADREEIIRRLEAGIADLVKSDSWARYLEFSRRFTSYSANNVLLVMLQRPDTQRVAGFHTWKTMGRSVRKGARGIAIICPVVRRTRVRDQDSGEEHVLVGAATGFRIGHVFAYEDTEGDRVPELPCHRLDGDDPAGSYSRLAAVAASMGYTVEAADHLPSGCNGDCNFAARRIRIATGNQPEMKVKVLIHELGHALLHDPAAGYAGSREQAELEAESVAFVAGDGLGLDTSAYSFGYIASWSGGGKEAVRGIAAGTQRINKATKQILELLDAEAAEAGHAA